MIRVKRGNAKLHRNIGLFNLPTVTTCPGAGECLKFCYAMKPEKLYKGHVVSSRHDNFKASLDPAFATDMVREIRRLKVKVFRPHESGDLYNQSYVNKWVDIARQLSDVRFFLYTKSLHLDLSVLSSLPNVTLIKSYGGKLDFKIDKDKDHYARVVDTPHDVKPGEYMCPDYRHGRTEDEKICGNLCRYCYGENHKVRVCFVKH